LKAINIVLKIELEIDFGGDKSTSLTP
jgi:hypothetical protein